MAIEPYDPGNQALVKYLGDMAISMGPADVLTFVPDDEGILYPVIETLNNYRLV